METVLRIVLLLAGLLNLLPGALVFLPGKISTSYGVAVPNVNYELLLRHRAALFIVVGTLLVFAAVTRRHYGTAVAAGLFSMVSFVALYFLAGAGVNAELKRVMQLDVAAALLLAVAAVLYFAGFRPRL
jgi:hypothetical protein